MSSPESLRNSIHQVQVDQQHAADALRLAAQTARQQDQQQHQQHPNHHNQHSSHSSHQHQQQHQQHQHQQHHLQQQQQHQQDHKVHIHMESDHHQLLLQQQHQQQLQQAAAEAAAVSAHHLQYGNSPSTAEMVLPELTVYDLKSRETKYRRWTPKMDQFLVKLLSDVVHSYQKGAEAEMTKKAWGYVTGQLRAANPETVYSTYTKYSCQQHLLNVNHHRYKIWYELMTHSKDHPSDTGYSYRWNPDIGRFQIIENTTNSLMLDERQIKSLLYSESLSLPSLGSFNKGNLIVNDFFLSDNLKYMSVYHNEILPLLIRLDPKYAEGLGDVYDQIPKFDYLEASNPYFKPLVPARLSKNPLSSPPQPIKVKKRLHSEDASDISLPFSKALSSIANDNDPTDVQQSQQGQPEDDSVDPALKRSRSTLQDTSAANTISFENALATAAIDAINSPAVTNGRDSTPFYIKDRKWFNKLLSLNESGHIGVEEVLSVCEGVRDGKIPLFMLNVLDQTYQTRNTVVIEEELPDEEMAKRIRQFMLPMVYNS